MTEKPKRESENTDTAEFQPFLKNLADMPHTPHPKPEPGRKAGLPAGTGRD